MQTRLKNIATLQTGLFAQPIKNGDLVYLQSKHFDEDGQLQKGLKPDLLAGEIGEKHILKPGDVVFAAKGNRNFAAVFENHNVSAVASTSFFVIKLTDNNILPEYLAWFLNASATQAILKDQAQTTSIPSISKIVLENLEIIIPTIHAQKIVLEVEKLRRREKLLRKKIELLRDSLTQQQIQKCININDNEN